MKKVLKNQAITPSERANTLRAFFKFGRKYPNFWGFIQAHISFPDMFETLNAFADKLDFSDQKKVKDWITMALSDFSASRKLYKAEDGLALYHLQQGIEKLCKACLIFTGFQTEAKVVSLNHKPHDFISGLLKDPNVSKVVQHHFPLKGIKKPRIEDKAFIEMKKGFSSPDKQEALEQGDKIVQIVSGYLGMPNPIIFDPVFLGDISIKFFKKNFPPKELSRLKKEISVKGASFEEIVHLMCNDYFILINMALILMPLSIGVWAFGSVPRYPDEMRSLKKDMKEYEFHKAFYTILNHVEKFGEFFLEYLKKV